MFFRGYERKGSKGNSDIGAFWKIFPITSSRRRYSKGLAFRRANMTEL
jgi:hypothetical protein